MKRGIAAQLFGFDDFHGLIPSEYKRIFQLVDDEIIAEGVEHIVVRFGWLFANIGREFIRLIDIHIFI